MPAKKRKQPKAPTEFEIWTEIAGLHIGQRKAWAARYCKPNTLLEMEPEPENPADKNAIAIGVTTHGLWGSKTYHIGYLPRADAATVSEHLARGWDVEGWVYAQKWSDEGWLYVKINVLLTPPARPPRPELPLLPEAPKPAHFELDEPPMPRFKPRLQLAFLEITLQRTILIATLAIAEGVACILLGLIIGALTGRTSDVLGLGVVATAAGAGAWAIALLSRVKPTDAAPPETKPPYGHPAD